MFLIIIPWYDNKFDIAEFVPALPTWCNDLEKVLGPCFLFSLSITPGVFPEFPETLMGSLYLLSVICLAPCSGKLPVVSVYIEDLILLEEDFGWDLEIDGLSAAVLFLQLWGRRV